MSLVITWESVERRLYSVWATGWTFWFGSRQSRLQSLWAGSG